MKAIVLSCERHYPIMWHMIKTYDAIWSKHPFTFVAPCETSPERWSSVYPGVEFVPAPREIRRCVLSLLAGLLDEEWIYWCIDDKYLVKLDVDVAEKIFNYVTNIKDSQVCGISLGRSRNLLFQKNLYVNDSLSINESIMALRRRNYHQIWYHQFLRVRVIRSLFEGFPDRDFVAKEMDAFIRGLDLPTDQRLYVAKKNAVAFGESTTRGKLTRNCAESMASYGLPMPDDFAVSNASIEMGVKPMFLEKLLFLAHHPARQRDNATWQAKKSD